MNKLTGPEEKTLFEGPHAPLGTFYAKIHIAYSLGVLTGLPIQARQVLIMFW